MTELGISIAIIVVRLLVPLSILRWPLAGAIASIAADTLDHYVLRISGFGLFADGHYQFLDKLLDTWYLCFLLLAMRRWTDPLARRVGMALFAWRFIGVVVFEISGWRPALALFPNVVENFFLIWAVITKWSPGFRLTGRSLVFILTVATVPKVYQELMMHVWYPDQSFSVLRPFPDLRTWFQSITP